MNNETRREIALVRAEVVRLTPRQSQVRAKLRARDVWPDPARYTKEQALDGLHMWTDPFIVSLFRNHHNKDVRRFAEQRWQEVRNVA